MSDVILPRRVVPQPNPQLVPGGDCGACVLGGLLGLSVPDVYGRLQKDGKSDAFSWEEMRLALWLAQAEGLVDRLVDDVPLWPNRMVVGARERTEDRAITPEILVSCSSTRTPDEEWVDVSDFLLDRGGFNVLLARPAQ